MRVRESHPLAGETIDIWRIDLRRSVATEISVAQIVSKNHHDIWPRIFLCERNPDDTAGKENADSGGDRNTLYENHIHILSVVSKKLNESPAQKRCHRSAKASSTIL